MTRLAGGRPAGTSAAAQENTIERGPPRRGMLLRQPHRNARSRRERALAAARQGRAGGQHRGGVADRGSVRPGHLGWHAGCPGLRSPACAR